MYGLLASCVHTHLLVQMNEGQVYTALGLESVCVCVWMCVWVCVCEGECVCEGVGVCVCVRVSQCRLGEPWECACVWVCMCVWASVHTWAWGLCVYTCEYTYVSKYVHECECVHVWGYVWACVYTYADAMLSHCSCLLRHCLAISHRAHCSLSPG